MLKPSGGFLKKIFSAPAKAAGAVAGGAKAMGGAVAGPVMQKKKAPAGGAGKSIFGKKVAAMKGQ